MKTIDMKSPSCGAVMELTGDGKRLICPYCGESKLYESTYDTSYQTEKGKLNAREDFATEQDVKAVGNMFNYGRMESVNSKEANRKLFSLYDTMTFPVSQYEEANKTVREDKEYLKKCIKNFIPPVIEFAITFGVTFGILIVGMLICALILDGPVFRPIRNEYHALPEEQQALYGTSWNYLASKSLIYCIFSEKKLSLYHCDNFEKYLQPNGEYMTDMEGNIIERWTFKPLLFTIIIVGVYYIYMIVSTIIQIGIRKGRISHCEKLIPQMEEALKPMLMFCPVEMRSSKALKFLADSYKFSRADNIKEAINLFHNENDGADSTINLALTRYAYGDGANLNDIDSIVQNFNQNLFSQKL